MAVEFDIRFAYTEVKYTVSANVAGVDPMHTGEGKREFQPDRIMVVYHYRTDVEPVGWDAPYATVTGLWSGEHAGTGTAQLLAGFGPSDPEWVREFEKLNRPLYPPQLGDS